MRSFGISLWPEKLSDEQYIERLRKNLKTRRRWRYLLAAMAAGLFVMVIWLLIMAGGFLSDLSHFPEAAKNKAMPLDSQQVYTVFTVAIFMGFIVGYFLHHVAAFVVQMLFGFRQQELLVECWDSLSDAEKGRLRQRST